MMELFAGVLHDGGHRALQPGQCGAHRQARDPRHQHHKISVVCSGPSGYKLFCWIRIRALVLTKKIYQQESH